MTDKNKTNWYERAYERVINTDKLQGHYDTIFADWQEVAINDVSLPLVELIESLSIIAGQHGVGRVDNVEAPAGVVLHAALQAGAACMST